MAKTRSFDVRVLVCSDLIARGVDVERVDLVVNLDMPPSVDTYLHRVGRTGRFGSRGVAISLVSLGEETEAIRILQRDFNVPILSIDTVDQIIQTGVPSRKLQREDVLAFSKLKAIQESKKAAAFDLLGSASRPPKRPKLKIPNHKASSPTKSPPPYAPQSNLNPCDSQPIAVEAALPTPQSISPYTNPFLKFWWDHFKHR